MSSFCLMIVLALVFSFGASANPSFFSFQGRVFDSAGEPLNSGTTTIALQILDPSASCLLHEETHNADMEGTGGYFNVSIGLGALTANSPTIGLPKIFDNSAPLTDAKLNCAGNTYTPAETHHRLLRVTINGETLSPDTVINSAPFAMVAAEAQKLSGKKASDFIQNDGSNVTQSKVQGFFNAASGLGNNQSLRWNSGSSDWETFTPGAAGSGINSLGVSAPLVKGGTTNDPTLSISAATTSAAGTMSSADKIKLDGIAANAEVNVSPDWNASSGDAFIANKPDLTYIIDSAGTSGQLWRSDGSGAGTWWTPNYLTSFTESDPTVPANIKDGISWSEVSGKPTFADGHSLDASDGAPANALFVDADGDVGIGTSSPSNALSVQKMSTGSGWSDVPLRVTSNTPLYLGKNNIDEKIYIMADPGGSAVNEMWIGMDGGNGASGKVHLVTGPDGAAAERLTVDRLGNVGIGFTAPGQKLDVNGNIRGTQLCIGADCRSAWPSAGGSGTVTSVAAGTGLTGGTITATGTIAVDHGTTANKILRLDGSARIPAVNGSLLTNLNASNVSSGTVDNARLDTDLQDLADGTLSSSRIQNGSFMIGSAGINGQLWRSDGSGAGTWWTPNYLTSFTETDPQVGSMTNGRWCRSDGSQVICDVNTVTDTNTTYSAGDDLDLSGTTFSLENDINVSKVRAVNSTGLALTDDSGTSTSGVFVRDGGNVGIGTTTPQSSLHVSGYTQLDTVAGTPPASDCDAAAEYGRMKVDPATSAMWVCMNSGWVNTNAASSGGDGVSGAAASKTALPAAGSNANKIYRLDDTRKLAYSDGTVWRFADGVVVFRSCKDHLDAGASTNGIYTIAPAGGSDMSVYCDMTSHGGGWTLVKAGIGAVSNTSAKWGNTAGFGTPNTTLNSNDYAVSDSNINTIATAVYWAESTCDSWSSKEEVFASGTCVYGSVAGVDDSSSCRQWYTDATLGTTKGTLENYGNHSAYFGIRDVHTSFSGSYLNTQDNAHRWKTGSAGAGNCDGTSATAAIRIWAR